MSKPSTGKTVRFSLDPDHPPTMTQAQLARLQAMKEEDIDFSDIPRSPPDAVWHRASALIPDTKQQVTLRLDRDVLEFFKQSGKRYQTRINSVLRAFVEAQPRPGRKTG